MGFRTLYHGTSRERAASILAGGVDLEAPRTRDPGDFGWGFYLTASISRARACGEVVLEVVVDTSTFAYLPYPYFLKRGSLTPVEPSTEAERLFHKTVFTLADDQWWRMTTVKGTAEEREHAARKVRTVFLAHGHAGIETPHDEGEVVVFDPTSIHHIHSHTHGEAHVL